MQTKIIAILIILVGLVFYLRKDKKPLPVQAPQVVENAVESQNIELLDEQTLQEGLAQKRKRSEIHKAARSMGFRPATKLSQGKLELTVSLAPRETGCRRGDLDIINDDLRLRNANGRLYLTIESLRDRKLFYQKLVEEETLRKGETFKIALPGVRDRDYFGLFLCTKASSERDVCQLKQAGNMSRLDEFQRLVRLENRTYPQEDRTFFFQFMAILDNNLMIFDMSRRMNEDFERMAKLFQRLEGRKQTSTALFQRVRRWVQEIGSVPPDIKRQHLTLFFPHKSDSCRL